MTRAAIRRCASGLAAALTMLAVMSVAQTAYAGETPAQPLKQVPPDYPEKAMSRSVEGWVELEFVVGADGKVRNVSVVKAEPMKTFESAAVKAIQKWQFEPATRDGAPVESQVRRKFTFKL